MDMQMSLAYGCQCKSPTVLTHHEVCCASTGAADAWT